MKANKNNQENKNTKEIKTVDLAKKVKSEKTEKDKAIKNTAKKAKANLIEEVVSKREVKYVYPADCQDTLSRKKFRQEVRNKVHQLELKMLRIKDKTSKEFKEAEKAYKAYKSQYVKDQVAI